MNSKSYLTRLPHRWLWVFFQVTIVAVGFGVAALIGCGKAPERPAPPTYPVSGQLMMPDGSPPPAGCVVEFRPVQGSLELRASGVTDSEGRFSVAIPYPDRKIPGASEGPHRVTARFPLGGDRHGGEEFWIAQEFVIKPSENKSENNFKITLPDSAR